MNIPNGFKLVPVEPTEEMLSQEVMPILCLGSTKNTRVIQWRNGMYKAMVSAAPPVELPAYDEAKERELFEAYHSISSGLEGTDLDTEFDRKEDGEYIYMMAADGWKYWKACAKSRARSAE